MLYVCLLAAATLAFACDSTKCRENGAFDDDCCGIEGMVGCASGYSMSFSANNGCLWNAGTCCTEPIPTTCDASKCTEDGGRDDDCCGIEGFVGCDWGYDFTLTSNNGCNMFLKS